VTAVEPQPPDAGGALEAFDRLARSRRTSLRVDPDRPVPPELVDRLLGLAVWAPNHKKTWPWRFAVVTGPARSRLGELVAAGEERRGAPEPKVTKARTKYLRAPLVLLVGSAWSDDPQRRVEDRDAVAAGVQNLLLAATAAGLASHWATGDWMADPEVKAFAGLDRDDELVALVYLGWPTGEVPVVDRPDPVVRRVES
jgi:nitroreductase